MKPACAKMPRGTRALAHSAAGLLLLIVLARAAAPVTASQPQGSLEEAWWNDRVFYEIFIRSFQDSDGDGIGDIQGVIDRLDYLNDGNPETTEDLGITGVWLMPPTEARSYHGYDVTDYYRVDSDYGTQEDMRRLVAAAHERDIAVIIDMVINHSSSRHPWFIASRIGEEPYADWYIWADEHPGYVGPWGAPAWRRAGQRYYYAVFWDGMPDFNLLHSGVTREMYNIATFWLRDIGVDGFRLDAVKHLIEVGNLQENRPESRQWLSAYEAHLESIKPNSFTVGEAYGAPSFVLARYVDERAMDIGFDFDLAEKMIEAAQRGNKRNIARAHRRVMRDYPLNQFATFLTNHDQDRLANKLLGHLGRNKVAASLLLTGPGVPFIYYGEEIGMAGSKPDERIRSPMQWDDSQFAGFTAGASVWQALQSAENVALANIAAQSGDPASLLSHYRSLIQLRNANSALRRGQFTAVDSSSSAVYAFLRHDSKQTLLVLINLDDEAAVDFYLNLKESELDLSAPSLIFGKGEIAKPVINASGGFSGYRPLAILLPHTLAIIAF